MSGEKSGPYQFLVKDISLTNPLGNGVEYLGKSGPARDQILRAKWKAGNREGRKRWIKSRQELGKRSVLKRYRKEIKNGPKEKQDDTT